MNKFDPTAPIELHRLVHNDSARAKHIHVAPSGEYPVWILWEGDECPKAYSIEGYSRFCRSLVLATLPIPKPAKSMWLNVYPTSGDFGNTHSSTRAAKLHAGDGAVCYKITCDPNTGDVTIAKDGT